MSDLSVRYTGKSDKIGIEKGSALLECSAYELLGYIESLKSRGVLPPACFNCFGSGEGPSQEDDREVYPCSVCDGARVAPGFLGHPSWVVEGLWAHLFPDGVSVTAMAYMNPLDLSYVRMFLREHVAFRKEEDPKGYVGLVHHRKEPTQTRALWAHQSIAKGVVVLVEKSESLGVG